MAPKKLAFGLSQWRRVEVQPQLGDGEDPAPIQVSAGDAYVPVSVCLVLSCVCPLLMCV
jgi:hypothetical protein